MQKITCPKCRAGKAALHLSIEHLESTKVKTLRCVACGWRESREVHVGAKESAERPADTVSNNKRGRGAHPESQPCRLQDCAGRYMPRPHNLPLCSPHRKQMEQWLSSKRTRPAPFVEDGERWIMNPQRIMERDDMGKAAGLRTCLDCGLERPHRAKGLCQKCYDARKWQKRKVEDATGETAADTAEPFAAAARPVRPHLLTLRFIDERDLRTLNALQAAAAKNRRTLDAQAMTLLEDHLEVQP